jgi:hypothetical protein
MNGLMTLHRKLAMTRNQTTLSLPVEHVLQLRQLAEALRIPLTRLVGRMVKREIDDGALPDATPGFAIKGQAGIVTLAVEGAAASFALSAAETEGLASSLEAVADKSGAAHLLPLDSGGMISVSRRGKGVVIELDGLDGTAKQKRTIVPDIAHDIARQLRSAAARK